MPYIPKSDREKFNYITDTMFQIETPGELNYLITRLILNYKKHKGESYQTANDILGALEGVKLEFYRRDVGPYEIIKSMQNGDIY